MEKYRLIGEYPVIGIRPTIDGRKKRRSGIFGRANHEYGIYGCGVL